MDRNDALLRGLNDIFPIGNAFQHDLVSKMRMKQFNIRKRLLKKDKVASKAWRLEEGIVGVIDRGLPGSAQIVRIIMPGTIFTDLDSFFRNRRIRFDYVALTDVKVNELTRDDFKKLKKHPETAELVVDILLSLAALNEVYLKVLRQPAAMRVAFLAENHVPFSSIPDEHAANYLELAPEDYLAEKARFLARAAQLSPAASKRMITNPKALAFSIKAYILDNYRTPICRENLAERFNTSVRSMDRTFKDTFGTSIYQTILRLKMEHALKLLQEEKMQVKTVAERMGYDDPFVFSKIFKKYYSLSPNDARKQATEEKK